MDSPAIRRTKAREVGPEVHLPYLRHASEHVLTLSTGALITCIRLEGISFETADPADLNELHAKLNLTLRNIADERLALWTHVIRRREHEYPCGTFRSDFARGSTRLTGRASRRRTSSVNELTLTLVWHPGRDPIERAATFLTGFGRSRSRAAAVDSELLSKSSRT